MRFVGILSCIAASAALTQEVVVAVELHLDFFQPGLVVGSKRARLAMLEQAVFLGNEILDTGLNRGVFHGIGLPVGGRLSLGDQAQCGIGGAWLGCASRCCSK